MKNILRIVIIFSVVLNLIGCDKNTKEAYINDYSYVQAISPDTLVFSNSIENNYPLHKDDFEEDMNTEINKVKKTYKVETTEGKDIVSEYIDLLNDELDFAKSNWGDVTGNTLLEIDKRKSELSKKLKSDSKIESLYKKLKDNKEKFLDGFPK